jgi:hypothetical protein
VLNRQETEDQNAFVYNGIVTRSRINNIGKMMDNLIKPTISTP